MKKENNETISRRKFLKTAAISAGGVVVACAGLAGISMIPPDIDFIENIYGEETSMKKVLIAYASKCGSTGEVAEAIARELGDAGYAVDVKLAKETKNISGYEAVVVGSAIRMGSPLGDAVKFIKKNKKALEEVPTAYFSVGLAMKEGTEEKNQEALSFMQKMVDQNEPQAKTAFAGVVDYSKLAPFYRKMFSMADDGSMGEGDFRDWDAIHAWAAELPALFG